MLHLGVYQTIVWINLKYRKVVWSSPEPIPCLIMGKLLVFETVHVII